MFFFLFYVLVFEEISYKFVGKLMEGLMSYLNYYMYVMFLFFIFLNIEIMLIIVGYSLKKLNFLFM